MAEALYGKAEDESRKANLAIKVAWKEATEKEVSKDAKHKRSTELGDPCNCSRGTSQKKAVAPTPPATALGECLNALAKELGSLQEGSRRQRRRVLPVT